ncbi:MAG: TetR/AcrR family transcriptional regulator [Calditrichaeota bacterium]|nr:TetR/AcrR family transcriptional regulator [Calditrichota bacterium]
MEQPTKSELKIFQAAKEIFLEKGKEGASMREIAKRADINASMLYYYFRSKDKLYERVFIEELHTFFGDFIDSFVETVDFQAFLHRFIDTYTDKLAKHPHIIRFILWELDRGAGLVTQTLHAIFDERGFSRNPLLQRVEQAISDGHIRRVDPLNLILTLIGACLYPFIARPIVERIFTETDILDQDFSRRRKTEIFDVIWNGVKPDSI